MQDCDLPGQFTRRGLEQGRRGAHLLALGLPVAQGIPAGQRLDATHAGGNPGFGQDGERSGLSRGGQMGAAAKFNGFPGHLHHAHIGLVFFPKEGHGLLFAHRRIIGHDLGDDGRVGQDGPVDLVLDPLQLFGRKPGDVREVETQPRRTDQGPGLLDMLAEHPAQGRVQQVGGGMVAGRGDALPFLDKKFHFLIGQDFSAAHLDLVHDQSRSRLQGIKHPGAARGSLQPAGVAHLSARLAVERGLQRDHEAGASGQALHRFAFGVEEGHDAAGRGQAVVADELGFHSAAQQSRELSGQALVAGAGPGFLGFLLLHGHVLAEARLVHTEALLFGDVVDDIERKSIGVIKLEGRGTGNGFVPAGSEGGHFVLQNAQTLVQSLAEAFFFLAHDTDHEFLAGDELREGFAHLPHDLGRGLAKERLVKAQKLAETVGPANQTAQHVASPLVGGQHAVGQQKGDGPAVIGDDPQRSVRVLALAVGHPGFFGHGLDEALEKIGIKIGTLALTDGGDALQTHARVDAGLGQGGQGPVRRAVELHEDQIPDFQIAVAVALADTAVRTAGHVRALINVDFGAGAAGTGITHGPEIVLLSEAEDAFGRHPGHLLPQLTGLVVVAENGDEELRLVEAELHGHEIPGQADGVFLEIITEGKVAEHFEKGVMARRATHVFQVVVLAAHAQAFLGRDRPGVVPLFLAKKDLLELDHARIGEQESRVILGHQGGTGLHTVAIGLKIFQKTFANFASTDHVVYLVRPLPKGCPNYYLGMELREGGAPCLLYCLEKIGLGSTYSTGSTTAGASSTGTGMPRCSSRARSICRRRSSLSCRKARTFSLPCPSRSEPKAYQAPLLSTMPCSTPRSISSPTREMPVPKSTSYSASRKGGAILFFTTLTRTRLP